MRLILLSILAAFALQACNTKFASEEYDLVIQNVKLFNGDSVLEQSTVLIKDGLVEKIISDKTSFTGDNVISAEGKTLIPGLVNAHTHAYTKNELWEAARAGVLTVISLGHSRPKLADSLRILSIVNDTIAYFHSAGNTVTVPNGHGTQFGKVPVVSDVDSVRQFVKDRIDEGSEFIKLIVDSGSEQRPLPTLSDEMVRAVIQTAQEYDKISIAHIWKRADAIMVAKAKANGLAHIWATDTTPMSEYELEILSNSEIFIIPTLVMLKSSLEKWNNQDQIYSDVYRLYKAGIPVLTGTDAARGRPVNFGSSLHDELGLLVQCGISPIDALRSATSIPSTQLSLGEKGRIEVGYSADFVLINGDPTEDISPISNIDGVWKKGKKIIL